MRELKPDITRKCFDKDWSDMKQLKYKKSDSNEVKATVAKYYSLIKAQYSYQAGIATTGKVLGVSMNQFGMFCEEFKLFDKQNFTLSDADRFFITVNAT